MALMRRPDMFRVTSLLMALAIYNQMLADISSNAEEIKGESGRNNRVMYDLSEIHVKEIKNGNNNLSDLYSDGDTAATFYYAVNENVSKNIQSENETMLQGDAALPGISFILFGNASANILLHLSNKSFFTGTSANLSMLRNSSLKSVVMSAKIRICGNCHFANSRMTRYLVVTTKQFMESEIERRPNVKLGFEYNQNLIECCADFGYDILKMVDYTVLNVEVSPLTTKLSYGGFSEMMARVIKQNREFVRKYNSNCTLYVRLIISNWNDVISADKTTYDRYKALIAKYFFAWENSSTDNDTYYILPLFPKEVISGNKQFLKEKVACSFSMFLRTHWLMVQINDPQILQLIACEIQDEIRQLLRIYRKIVFHHSPPELLNLISSTSQIGKTSLKNLSEVTMNPSNIILDRWYLSNSTINNGDFIGLLNSYDLYAGNLSQLFNINSIYLDSNVMSGLTPEQLLEVSRLKNTRLDCYMLLHSIDPLKVNLSGLLKETVKECSPLLNVSQEIVWDCFLRIEDTEELLEFLKSFQKAKMMLESRYPNKHLILKIWQVGDCKKGDRVSCKYNSRSAEYYQTILSFANIHQWTRMIVSSDIDTYTNKSKGGFRMFWRTNAEKAIAGDLPMTFPCIQYTQTANQSGIGLPKNNLSGSTFPVKLRQGPPLTAQELEKALRFVFGRFLFVELIASDVYDFIVANNAVSQSLLRDMQAARHPASQRISPLLYIEIPLSLVPQLPKKVSNASLVAVHVHVTDWFDAIYMNQEISFSQLHKSFHSVGITVQNCWNAIDEQFFRLIHLPFIKTVTYIVCNLEPVLPGNLGEEGLPYDLENLLYVKTHIEKFLPQKIGTTNPIEVMFRVNLISSERKCSVENSPEQSQFLRFLNDMSQHSAFYKIRYFVVRAFETEKFADRCPYTWWHLKNYTDLTDDSVYVDTENEYFGRPTKIGIPFLSWEGDQMDNKYNNTKLTWIIWIFAALTSVILISATVIILITWRRFKKRLLSREEVKQFYNGVKAVCNEMEMENADLVASMHMKFPKKFEVPFKDIEIGALVGSGQFGLVHRGVLLSQPLEVAIKIPKSDCGREQFLSTLSELKILGYIGIHENVVSFLGACTKQIGMGKLHIITEFCGMGSLFSFLRNMQAQPNNVSACPDLEIDLFQLYRFSHQIASGMEYVAQKRIIHGDLATRNILLTSDLTCKVADFGLSRRLYELNEYKKKSKEPLPWRWMAPESLNNMEFSTKSDVWSYGVTIWEIFSLGKVPYPGKTWTDNFASELESGMRMVKAQYASDDIHNKTLDCWNKSIEERPTFTELKQFFADLRNTGYLNLESPEF